jgi:hypothetical protein
MYVRTYCLRQENLSFVGGTADPLVFILFQTKKYAAVRKWNFATLYTLHFVIVEF